MRHVVMFSGGAGSWAAARRVADNHGHWNVSLLFADTLIEDADLYRFLVEAAANIYRCSGRLDGIAELAAAMPPSTDMDARREHLSKVRGVVQQIMPSLWWLVDGRTIWDVFRERKFLGNTRADLCSRILKREICDRWLTNHYTPETVTVHVGIDWTEEHRYTRLRERKLPWRYEAPLCSEPYLTKDMVLDALKAEGIRPPRLYGLGFAHNNCGGGCVKAGIGHFAHLLNALPDVYAEWEANEEAMRAQLGDVSILRDRAGGETKPLPLTQLRRRLADGGQVDAFEIGGCGCFVDGEAA